MRKSALAIALGLTLSILSASKGYADATATASITYSGPGAGGGSDGPNSGATQAQATANDAANLAKAQTDAWTVKSFAKLDLIVGQSNGAASATASYADSITVSASDPGTAIFVFHVNGTLTPGSDYTLTALYNGGLVDNPTWSYEGSLVESLWGFAVPFTPGVPFDFQIESRSRAFQSTGGTGAVVTDFFNTTSLDSIQLDVPFATIAGASGFDYESLVPEPASLTLLGLIGLSTQRRRVSR